MRIQDIEVSHRTQQPGDYPTEWLPEICFLGRSNVGKSSLINTLVNRKGLARTSRDPGRTRAIWWYRLEGQGHNCFFVDLPGYGYAKVSKALREETWARLIDTYLESERPLTLAIQLLDIRRDGPTDLDWQMIRWLREIGVPHVFALTKSDKLKRGRRMQAVDKFRRALECDAEAGPIPFSAVTGEGKKELWSTIDGRLEKAAA